MLNIVQPDRNPTHHPVSLLFITYLDYQTFFLQQRQGRYMEHLLYVEISVIGVCLLLIILFNQHRNAGSSTLQRQFSRMIYATIAMLITDTACWLLDGAAFPHARTMKIASETLYFILDILIPFLWVVYLECAISKGQKVTYRRLRILAIPMIVMFMFVILNLHSHHLFTVDENNVYHRESGFVLFAIISYTYLVYASARALFSAYRADWQEDKRRYYALALFPVLPGIGGIIQSFVYGVSLIWVFVAVSIMLMYIDFLNRQISADPLTGINNRRELRKYILRGMKDPANDDGILALIMMDVDNFKQVNDTYGHYYGDEILITVAEILKQSCKNTPAFLARFGGDEFCIVYPAKNMNDVEKIITKILSSVIRWNTEHSEPIDIGLSVGYSLWQPDADDTLEDLYRRADDKMYEAKSMKKKLQEQTK
jgi:diguanylate cyclase (GGDEF)-like protein